MRKVQRLERKLVGSSDPKRKTPDLQQGEGDEIVCSVGRPTGKGPNYCMAILQ